MDVPSVMNGTDKTKKRVYKVVLTGGPCGGKTTGQSRLCTFFENLGWKVFRASETAFIFLSGGIKFSELTEDEGVSFQEHLLKTMIEIENTFFSLAESCNKNVLVICDRGTMDASAFIAPEKWEAIMQRGGFNPVDLRDTRYHQVVHMVSASHGAEAFYSMEEHVTRNENMDLARHLDDRAAEAWVGHPYFDVVDNSTDFDTKIRRMINVVCQKIGIDTGDRLETNARKLKFLVKGPVPDDDVFPSFQDFSVEHVYLKTTSRKTQARLRKRGKNGHHSYTHTIRKPEKLGQVVEVKTALTARDWSLMQAQADRHHFKIFKKRRCFLHNNQYFQLDIYQQPCHTRCEGLIFLETYSTLSSVELRRRLPSFLDIIEDVTGKPEYSMFNLSLVDDWKTTANFCHSIADDEKDQLEEDSSSIVTTLPSTISTIHLCPHISTPHTTQSAIKSFAPKTSEFRAPSELTIPIKCGGGR